MSKERRWSRELALFLWAFLIAFFIWLIAVQADREVSWVSAPLRIENVPENMIVTLQQERPNAPQAVQVNVQFPREQLGRINAYNLAAVIDVAEVFSPDPSQWSNPLEPREQTYKLNVANIRTFSLPGEVDIIGVDPGQVTLQARLRTALVDVVVPTEGELPSQFELTGELLPFPRQVPVTGSQERLEALSEQGNQLQTTPVELSEINRSRQVYRELRLPEGIQLVNPSASRIEVNIGLQERAVTRVINEVPITLPQVSGDLRMELDPARASIRVEGPPSALDQLTAEDFTFSTVKPLEERAGEPQTVGLEASFRTRVAEDVVRRSRVMEVMPARISVEFVPLSGEDSDGQSAGEDVVPSF